MVIMGYTVQYGVCRVFDGGERSARGGWGCGCGCGCWVCLVDGRIRRGSGMCVVFFVACC